VNQLIVALPETGSTPLMLSITATVPPARERQYRTERLIRCGHVSSLTAMPLPVSASF
jgi:hypothetical protein